VNRLDSHPACSRRSLGLLILLHGLLIAACDSGSYHPSPDEGRAVPDRYTPVADSVPLMRPVDDGLSFREVRQFGSLDGDSSSPAFGRIDAVALSTDSILAVADGLACAIHRFHAGSGEYLGSTGRCGAGPGEFGQTLDLVYRGDTLLVLDLSYRRTTYVAPDGTVSRSSRDYDGAETMPFFRLQISGDTELRLPGWSPASGRTTTHQLVRSGEVVKEASLLSELLRKSLREAVQPQSSCVLGGSTRIVHANSWAREILLLDTGFNVLALDRDESPWPEPVQEPTAPGGWLTGHAFPAAVACGRDVALVRWIVPRMPEEPGGSPTVARALLIAVSSEGEVLHREIEDEVRFPAYPSLRPVVGMESLFTFSQNEAGPYPTVHLFEIERTGR
jgi:hypothetical protein